jgi:hypothetical protein
MARTLFYGLINGYMSKVDELHLFNSISNQAKRRGVHEALTERR